MIEQESRLAIIRRPAMTYCMQLIVWDLSVEIAGLASHRDGDGG